MGCISMNSREAATAIRRRSLSAPMKWLASHKLIIGPTLDFGCGHGYDAYCLGIAAYDPFHKPDKSVLLRTYDTVTCIYVLNVIKNPEERNEVVKKLLGLTKPGGTCYTAVRRDRQNLNGLTKSGTWQGWIEPASPWKSLVRNSRFEIFTRRM